MIRYVAVLMKTCLGILIISACGSAGEDFCVQYCSETDDPDKSAFQATAETVLTSTKSTEFRSSNRSYLERTGENDVGSMFQPGRKFSLSFWYKRSSSSGAGTQNLFINGNNTGLLVQASNKALYIKWGDNTDYLTWRTRDSLIHDSDWNHIAIIYNGEKLGDQTEYNDKVYHKNLSIYFNATKLEQGSGDLTNLGGRNNGISATSLGGTPFRVGIGYNTSNYGNFLLDEVTVWDVDLAAEDIGVLHNLELPHIQQSRINKKIFMLGGEWVKAKIPLRK